MGYGSIVASLVSWEAAGASSQGLQRAIPDMQLAVIRYLYIMAISGLVVFVRKTDMYISKEKYLQVFLAATFDLISDVCFYAGVSFLPLSHATGLYFGTRMIIIAGITAFYYGNHVNVFMVGAIVTSLVGLICLNQPWSILSDGFIPAFLEKVACPNSTRECLVFKSDMAGNITLSSVKEMQYINFYTLFITGLVVMFLAALFSGLHMITIGMYLKTLDPFLICFFSALIGLPQCIILMFYIEQPVFIESAFCFSLVTIHSVCTAFTNLFETVGYQLVSPLHASVIESIQPVLSLILQYTIFRNHLSGRMNFLEVLGCFIIIKSSILSVFPSTGDQHLDFNE